MTTLRAPISTLGRRFRQALWRAEAGLSGRATEPSTSRSTADYRVLVVCLGNYCRSPVAEGLLRAKLAELGLEAAVGVESAGTSAYYAGRPAHKHARREAMRRGIDIRAHRARGLDAVNLPAYDLVVAVDERTRRELSSVDPKRLVLLGSFGRGGDIADPNGCGPGVFAETHDAIDTACAGLARFVSDRLTAFKSDA